MQVRENICRNRNMNAVWVEKVLVARPFKEGEEKIAEDHLLPVRKLCILERWGGDPLVWLQEKEVTA